MTISSSTGSRRLVVLAALAALLSGCAALSPDRTVRSTMTLSPGQSIAGRFEIPDGGDGFVDFSTLPPRKGVEPFPEAWTYPVNEKVVFTFPSDANLPEVEKLSQSTRWLKDRRVVRVVVRNTDNKPVTFDWIVTGATDAIVNWDVSAPVTSSP